MQNTANAITNNISLKDHWLPMMIVVVLACLWVGLSFYIEMPLLLIIPLLPIFAYFFIFKTKALWWFIIFITPLSLSLELISEVEMGLYLPTEPLLGLFLIATPFYFLFYPPSLPFIKHPITIVIIGLIIWTGITAITSSQLLVSIKSWIAQLWFILPIYFLGHHWLKASSDQKRFLRLYTLALFVVVVYTFFRLYQNGFPDKASEWLMNPFYKDHTLLGASLGITIPYILLSCTRKGISNNRRWIWIIMAVFFLLVLIFTYSRAAILSLVAAFGLYLLLALKVPFKRLGYLALVAGLILFVQKDDIVQRFAQNNAQSSDEILENIESISNITTDASNVERINRWNSAIAMWKERPFLGWGPGTYQFQYAPFQLSRDQTIISTNFGDVGNAHSEFLGSLAESGILGAILKIAWVIFVVYFGYNVCLRTKGVDRFIALSCLLGFMAYFTHGVLNNFLMSDKASIPIWAFSVIIVHLDLKH